MMKLVKENLNERFKEDSDPVTDLGIGKINFEKKYFEVYKTEERKLYKRWRDYCEQFNGKSISGSFHTITGRKTTTIEIVEAEALNDGTVRFRSKDGDVYLSVVDETYKIVS